MPFRKSLVLPFLLAWGISGEVSQDTYDVRRTDTEATGYATSIYSPELPVESNFGT